MGVWLVPALSLMDEGKTAKSVLLWQIPNSSQLSKELIADELPMGGGGVGVLLLSGAICIAYGLLRYRR